MTTVLFCHGLESGPHGRKHSWLVAAGHDVRAPDCRGLDLAARIVRIREAIAAIARERREARGEGAGGCLLVGSSFGGIAGLVAACEATAEGHPLEGLVLCAPALLLWPHPLRAPAPTIVVHGRGDEIIPIEHSRAFVRGQHDAPVRLVEVDDDHRLGASRSELLAAVDALSAARRELAST